MYKRQVRGKERERERVNNGLSRIELASRFSFILSQSTRADKLLRKRRRRRSKISSTEIKSKTESFFNRTRPPVYLYVRPMVHILYSSACTSSSIEEEKFCLSRPLSLHTAACKGGIYCMQVQLGAESIE